MNDIDILEKKVSRQEILNFEDLIRQQEASFTGDDDVCPITHSFSDGIYVREMFAPKGVVIIGEIVKQSHHIFLMSGEIVITTENGQKTMKGPVHLVAEAGTKRIGYTVTDVVWVNIHPNPTNTQDIDQIKKQIIAPSYEAYEKYLEQRGGLVKKLKNRLIKLLS